MKGCRKEGSGGLNRSSGSKGKALSGEKQNNHGSGVALREGLGGSNVKGSALLDGNPASKAGITLQ